MSAAVRAGWGLGLLAVLALMALAALAEAALVSVNRGRLQQLAAEGAPGAQAAELLLGRREQLLGVLSLVLLLCLGALALLAALAGRGLGGAAGAGVLLGVLVLGLIAPKCYGVQHAEAVALRAAPAVRLLCRGLGPVAGGLQAAAAFLVGGLLVRVLGGQAEPEAAALSEEEIRELVTAGEQAGEMAEEEREMIQGIVTFADKVTREIMTPRTDIVALESTAGITQAIALIRRHGFSRIPLNRESVDDIVGVLFARDVLAELLAGRQQTMVAAIMRPAYFVPESKPVDDLLREMQQRQAHMAIVIDEYGGTAGLVTIEDLLEEIFGEIRDEYDAGGEAALQMVGEHEALVDGRLAVDEVAQAFAVELPEGEFDSMGGLVLGQLGRLPSQGERLQVGELELTVLRVSRHRVQKIRVRRQRVAGPGEG